MSILTISGGCYIRCYVRVIGYSLRFIKFIFICLICSSIKFIFTPFMKIINLFLPFNHHLIIQIINFYQKIIQIIIELYSQTIILFIKMNPTILFLYLLILKIHVYFNGNASSGQKK